MRLLSLAGPPSPAHPDAVRLVDHDSVDAACVVGGEQLVHPVEHRPGSRSSGSPYRPGRRHEEHRPAFMTMFENLPYDAEPNASRARTHSVSPARRNAMIVFVPLAALEAHA
jgi:hypothetical protein